MADIESFIQPTSDLAISRALTVSSGHASRHGRAAPLSRRSPARGTHRYPCRAHPRPAAAAAGTAQLLNIVDLAAPFELTRPTIRDYVTALERVFLLDRLPPWHTNRLSRLVKRPKLHMGDTGIACALLEIDAEGLLKDRPSLGPMLETFAFQEIRRQASWHPARASLSHFRDRDVFEVDIVIERGHAVAGVEVKAAATVSDGDLRGLRKLREAAGRRFAAGVVLYDGSATVRFDDTLFAVPIRMLWG